MARGRKWQSDKKGSFEQRLSFYIEKKIELERINLRVISKATKISFGSLSLWCNGHGRPLPKNLKKLCKYLGIDSKVLFQKSFRSK
jgi:transcriptional regulator with XRE-family HTH domain